MDRQKIARKLLRMARELISGLAGTFLKIKSGKRATITVEGKRGNVYAHVWFDDDVAEDDFGNRVKDSGEWQVLVSDSPDFVGGRQFGRENFRYADPKMRNAVARMAASWTEKLLSRTARRASIARELTAADPKRAGKKLNDLIKKAWDGPYYVLIEENIVRVKLKPRYKMGMPHEEAVVLADKAWTATLKLMGVIRTKIKPEDIWLNRKDKSFGFVSDDFIGSAINKYVRK